MVKQEIHLLEDKVIEDKKLLWRLFALFDMADNCCCWMWKEDVTWAPRFKVNGVRIQPVRILWKYFGLKPLGDKLIESVCKNARCVNPHHYKLKSRDLLGILENVEVVKNGVWDCWEWQGSHDIGGYGFLRNSNGKNKRLTHFMWESIPNNPKILPGLVLCHKCDNPPCINPYHLFLGTRKDNAMDMAEKGRSLRGERSPLAKLKQSEVEEIIALAKSGEMTQIQMAKKFGVAPQTVGAIVDGTNWKHIPR